MKVLTYSRVHHLSKLHDELLAAIQGLRPAVVDGERAPMMRIEGKDTAIRLEVPDGIDEAAIAAVVAAHDPAPVQTVDFERRAAIEVEAATTLAQVKQAMVRYLRRQA